MRSRRKREESLKERVRWKEERREDSPKKQKCENWRG
jgi:hypothetical protein